MFAGNVRGPAVFRMDWASEINIQVNNQPLTCYAILGFVHLTEGALADDLYEVVHVHTHFSPLALQSLARTPVLTDPATTVVCAQP